MEENNENPVKSTCGLIRINVISTTADTKTNHYQTALVLRGNTLEDSTLKTINSCATGMNEQFSCDLSLFGWTWIIFDTVMVSKTGAFLTSERNVCCTVKFLSH